MARTQEVIRASIVVKKNTYTELNSLNSISKTAIWSLIVDVVVFAIYSFEVLLDVFKADIDTIIENKRIGLLRWYSDKAKEFQLGDDIKVNSEYKVTYDVLDLSKRIVSASAAIEEVNSSITIKVAKGVVGAYAALSATEQSQFKGYYEKVKLAGTKINYVSLNADMLRLGACTVFYDSIYDPGVVAASFVLAVNKYLSSLDFNGKINVNDFIAYVKNNSIGVKDFTITTISSFQNAVNTAIVREYNFVAGYAVYDPANSTVTYTAV